MFELWAVSVYVLAVTAIILFVRGASMLDQCSEDSENDELQWWRVSTGSYKLGLSDRDEPVAYFLLKSHAHEYGAKLWPGTYSVTPCKRTEVN